MKYILTILVLTTLPENKQDLVGIYEYKSDDKSENHYIVFDKIEGQLKGFYFGTESGGEHGVFYYAVDMANLRFGKDGAIEFENGERDLFETTQFKIIKSEKRDKSVGHSRGVLKYKGKINQDTISLSCGAEFDGCWDNELIFEKVK